MTYPLYPQFNWLDDSEEDISRGETGALNQLILDQGGSDTASSPNQSQVGSLGKGAASAIGSGLSTFGQFAGLPAMASSALGKGVSAGLQGKGPGEIGLNALTGAISSAVPGLGLGLAALNAFGIDPVAELASWSNIDNPGLPAGFGYSWGMQAQPDDDPISGWAGLPGDIDAFSDSQSLTEAVESGNWGQSSEDGPSENSSPNSDGNNTGGGPSSSSTGTGTGNGGEDGGANDGNNWRRGGLIPRGALNRVRRCHG